MIIGHQRILACLKKSAKGERPSHAYLFAGPAHLGKRTAALEFIKYLTGQPVGEKITPDVLVVEPEIVEKDGVRKELEIGIGEARRIQRQMGLRPYDSLYKIVLIDKAEKMTAEAGNCLLKTLEEPSGQAIMILVTSNLKMILPTIVSRCQLINFLPVSGKEIEKKLDFAAVGASERERIIRLANGRPGLALEYLKNPALLREEKEVIARLEKILVSDINERYRFAEKMSKNVPLARQIINRWLFWFRDLVLLDSGCADLVSYPESAKYRKSYSSARLREIIKSIKKADRLLANPSINARLALEILMLEV